MSIVYDKGHIARRQLSGRNAIRDIVFVCLVTLVVVDSNVIRSEGSTSHLSRGLNTPCGPIASISDAATVFPIGSLHRDDILSKAEETRAITDQLRREIGMMLLPEIYSQEIIGLPGPEDISTYRNLTVDYTVVSHLLVFTDIVITDQGTSLCLWQELRTHILSLLCDLYKGMTNVPYISNDITLPCVRDASCGNQRSRFTRDRRSFVIASAVRDVLSRLHQSYSLLPVQ